MSNARYPSYQSYDSPTFDKLPAHWRVVRGRHLIKIHTGSGDTVDADEIGEFPFYVRSDSPLRSSGWEFDTTAVLTAGDGAGVAKVFHLVSGKFMAHQRVYVLHDFRGVTPEFFFYAFKSMFHLMALDGSAKSTVDSVRRHMIADMPFGVPPLDEQHAIADYLDQETAQIDALVAKQEEFIGLLRERRSALRDNALTNGPIAGQSIEVTESAFLPELPDGWRAVPTRRVLAFGPSNGVSPEAGRVGDLRSLSIGAVRNGQVVLSDDVTKFIDRSAVRDIPRLRLVSGDVLIVRGNGNIRLVGRAGLVGNGFDSEEYIYPDLLMRIRTGLSMLPEFFVEAFESPASRNQIELLARTTVGTYKVSAADIRTIVLPLPPIEEQLAIVKHINEQKRQIDTLISKAEGHVALAKERRSALITAAVTGQFDVRTAKKGARV
ncbi:restriction endonuclease subunit S [Pseudactinotalea sp. HY158]|uniref:restriction endonuclease subunit S n=1 Tax=Pseudactinotalea sp. HY158 TaxID=2654547 RepID=UPI00129C7BC4|nr:restriction endonuclease subunit S [Pseudactinotalea sp. HY158]QGH69574.1 hypothetical protein GCE65_08645 [Pseudactinotalea sp. HY158]